MAAGSGASARSASTTRTASTARKATTRATTKASKKATTKAPAKKATKPTTAEAAGEEAPPTRAAGRPTAPAAAPRRDAFAAGARRASGERARRTRTPLLPAAAPAGPAAVQADVLDPVAEPEVEPTAGPPVDGAGATPVPVAPEQPESPEAVPEDVPEVVPEDGRPPSGARKHRPRPAPELPVTPSPGVLARSGSRVDSRGRTGDGPARTGSARVASRAAARARRPLRAVPDLVPDGRAAAVDVPPTPAAGRRPPGPHPVTAAEAAGDGRSAASGPSGGTGIRPGLEELLQAGVAALRTAVAATGVTPEEVEQQVAATLAFLRRRLSGDFTVDEFGFDGDFTDHVYLPFLRPLYQRWFRVEVRGVENLPTEGGGLVVANHSGTLPLDALMTQVAVHDEHPTHRHLRMLGADLVFSTPVVGQLARKSGSTLATNPDAERLLREGELVGVWPEGFKGIGKPFSERYKLQRFGRGGFVSAAVSAGVPIIPCSIVGAEEIYPLLGNLKTVARLFGSPYAPVTPTWPLLGPLGLVPLPSKWIIEFGAPVRTADLGPGAAEDPMLVFDLTDQIRETIQQTLYSLLMQRRSVFF